MVIINFNFFIYMFGTKHVIEKFKKFRNWHM